MNITNGKIVYTRRLNTGDYSHKDACVELTFAVNDGEDPITVVDYVRQVAIAQAHLMTGEQAPNPTALPTALPAAAPVENAAQRGRRGVQKAKEEKAGLLPTGAPVPTVQEVAQAIVETAQSLPGNAPATAAAPPTPAPATLPSTGNGALPGGNVVPLPTTASAPTGSTLPGTAVAPAATPTAPAAGLPNGVATAPSTAATAAISDETLGQKVTAKLAEMRDILGIEQAVAVQRIHALIRATVGTEPCRLIDIKAEDREGFLTQLAALS